MPSFSFDIDPYAVLGVTGDASLQQIRDAYRSKTKKYHPDAGGEDWAFRILVQSYELLSTNRVMRATRGDEAAARPAAPTAGTHHDQGATRPRRDPSHRAEPKSETVQNGILDSDVPAHRRAAVELLSVRYLWEQASYLWLGQKSSDDDRFLSCSLHVSWPDRSQGATHLESSAEEAEILASLAEVFDHLVLSTRAVSSRSTVHEDGFEGWLTYSSFDRTWKAVRSLQESLHSRGLGIRQWSRDLFIPRNWS